MNKIKFITKTFVIGLVLLCQTLQASSYEDYLKSHTYREIESRLEHLDGAFDYKLNPEIAKLIYEYTAKYKHDSEALLSKGDLYFPLIEKEIYSKGLPIDLKSLPIIESHLRPNALSRSGAAGMWQFMKKTARMMGLNVNREVDERKDVIKSTSAALDYLAFLYKSFDDWTLAIAAYNCGPGNVRKAMRAGKSRNFWKIRPHLPKETQRYVPKFMAISYLLNYHDLHGIHVDVSALKDNPTTIALYDKTNFNDISLSTGLDIKEIKDMNPSYLRNYIPSSLDGNHLTLPESKLIDYILLERVEYSVIYQPKESKSILHIAEVIPETKLEEADMDSYIWDFPILESDMNLYVLQPLKPNPNKNKRSSKVASQIRDKADDRRRKKGDKQNIRYTAFYNMDN